MATLTGLIARTKLELGEYDAPFQVSFPGDGIRTQFELDYDNIVPGSVVVWLASAPNTPLTTPAQYTIDLEQGSLKVATPVAVGDAVIVAGDHTDVFSDTDVQTFVETAFIQHVVDRQVNYATLPRVEEYLVVILATVEGLWALVTSAARDIDVHTPEGVSIPRSQRFAQLMMLIRERTAQYKELAAALNVGIFRIEMLTLRRISRMTGRFVPEYLPQEIDDRSPPQRVFPPIDKRDAVIPDLEAGILNLTIDQLTGLGFTQDVQFTTNGTTPINITGYTFAAQLRLSPVNDFIEQSFLVTVTNAAQGRIRISLTEDEVTYLRTNHVYAWDLQWRPPSGAADTKLRGTAFITKEFAR